MHDALAAWIYAGGAHHTCYSQNLSAAHLLDFAAMASMECLVIGKQTRLEQFRNELKWNEMYYNKTI
jgi:L-arabinose isomerase